MSLSLLAEEIPAQFPAVRLKDQGVGRISQVSSSIMHSSAWPLRNSCDIFLHRCRLFQCLELSCHNQPSSGGNCEHTHPILLPEESSTMNTSRSTGKCCSGSSRLLMVSPFLLSSLTWSLWSLFFSLLFTVSPTCIHAGLTLGPTASPKQHL